MDNEVDTDVAEKKEVSTVMCVTTTSGIVVVKPPLSASVGAVDKIVDVIV